MEKFTFTQPQRTALIVLRLLIGWHFLYEGVIKLYNPTWTAKGYLLSAEFLSPLFVWLAQDNFISVVNTLNIAGLMIVGITLLLGVKEKWGYIAGIALLALYYLAHPPFTGITQGPAEGSYWIVNKNLIEIGALWVLYLFPTASYFGIQSLFTKRSPEALQQQV
jgi:thiosulfate dehydrogenase (quinone) large subunit